MNYSNDRGRSFKTLLHYFHSGTSQVLFVFIKLLSNLNYAHANNNYNA